MADIEKERRRLLAEEKKITGPLTERFNDLITVLFFIATSDDSLRDKRRQIKKAAERVRKFSEKFATKEMKRLYKKQVREAYKIVGQRPKKLTDGQEKELATFTTAVIAQLSGLVDKYRSIAFNVATRHERAKIRENFLGYEDGQERQAIRRTSTTRDFEFKDSKGRRIKADAVIKVSAGDTSWSTITAARNSVFLLAGLNYGYHRSIIDERTSDICLALDGQLRNLSKDPLPPMHPNCRSIIEPELDPNFRP